MPSGDESNPYVAPAASQPNEPEFTGYGDRNCEHLTMSRGNYPGTLYVGGAFVLTTALLTIPSYRVTHGLWIFAQHGAPDTPPDWLPLASVVLPLIMTWAIYRDRWLCIEAFASRFTIGLVNFSVIVALPAAFFYALYRGLLKTIGR